MEERRQRERIEHDSTLADVDVDHKDFPDGDPPRAWGRKSSTERLSRSMQTTGVVGTSPADAGRPSGVQGS
jgi:hypothetical protein